MRQNKFAKIQFDIADDGITNRSTIGGKAWVFEPVRHPFKNRNLIGKLKTLQAVSVESLSKNFKNLIQKLKLWELLQQILAEKTGMPSPPKTLITILPSRLTTRSLTTIASNQLKTYPLHTKLVSLVMLLTFAVVFVIPLTIFEELHAQSVPTLGSTKQFASDELKPYVDAAKAGSNDSGTFLNTVTNGEQVIEAAWEIGVNAEIEAILGGVTTSDSVNNVNVYKDAVRAQLELQKQQAKSRWIADVNAYVQAELQIFLAALSQNTSNNVTTSNTNAVNTINPTVQSVTTTPVSQATNPAQAAQSYYQGSQLWDTKWQDLLSKQNTWEQNSLSAIQTGILQWNQSITGLENDKLTYLNGIEQTKAQ
ncbi:TIGR04388 family protein, partial [Leptospira santarosai]|uniref:TIGR04388 family protein n=1 Tax=Leptospira santarosai TaxID=28183 RepID=UPI0024AFFBF5